MEALHTLYPGVNITDILLEDLGEEAEAGEGQEHEHEGLQGSEGGPGGGGRYAYSPHHYDPLQSLPPDAYGDYEVDFLGQPKASYRYVPGRPNPAGQGNVINIDPTPVLKPKTPNTEGGQARLFDTGGGAGAGGGGAGGGGGASSGRKNAGPFNPDRVVRHPTGMTASATLGVVVGTVILSWLLVGPTVCQAWRWNHRRRDRGKILLQRPHLRGSVDEGIMDAIVLSELGKAGHKGGKGGGRGKSSSSARRQTGEDVQASLARNRSELQSFPTTTTLESRVI